MKNSLRQARELLISEINHLKDELAKKSSICANLIRFLENHTRAAATELH